MDRSFRPTLWYGLSGVAFMLWATLATYSVFRLSIAAFQTINGFSYVLDWREPYLAVVCTAIVAITARLLWRFNRRERGAKRISPPSGAVALGFVFVAMIGIVGD